jgi:hypothetical protein
MRAKIFSQHCTLEEVIEKLEGQESVEFVTPESVEQLRKWLVNWCGARQGIYIARCVLSEEYKGDKDVTFRFKLD